MILRLDQTIWCRRAFAILQRQYSDLSEGKANLEAVISESTPAWPNASKRAFGKINEYFSDCYVRLFGGGTAALNLLTLMTFWAAVSISVQPPGKKLQNLFLLSGGGGYDGYRPAVRSARLSAFALLYP